MNNISRKLKLLDKDTWMILYFNTHIHAYLILDHISKRIVFNKKNTYMRIVLNYLTKLSSITFKSIVTLHPKKKNQIFFIRKKSIITHISFYFLIQIKKKYILNFFAFSSFFPLFLGPPITFKEIWVDRTPNTMT